jgi:integrase/recombinase XerD
MDGLHIESVTTRTIADVVKFRRSEGATNATIKRDLTALSSVLRYCCAQGWREDNPAMAYDRTVIRERRDPIVLPDPADVDYIAQRAGGNFGQAIRYALHTGMRQEEVFSLEWDQVRGTSTDLWKTKTSRVRAVQNSIAAQGTIKGTKRHTKSPWVFWHTDGQRYAEPGSQFRAIVQRALGEGKIKRAFRFHDLRHLFAVEYLRAGGLLYNLQKHMGHASIKTTELYLDYLTPEESHRAKFGEGAQKGHKNSGSQDGAGTETETENA